MPLRAIELSDEPPFVDALTTYDETHFTLYMQLLDAVAARAAEPEICVRLLDIDPEREPVRAHTRFEAHLQRARWFLGDGSHHLVDRDGYPLDQTGS